MKLQYRHIISGVRFPVEKKLADVLPVVISSSQINTKSMPLNSGLAFALLT